MTNTERNEIAARVAVAINTVPGLTAEAFGDGRISVTNTVSENAAGWRIDAHGREAYNAHNERK